MAGGKLAQSRGKTFEQMFQARCLETGVKITRVPDGCKTIGPRRLVRVKSPFDWIISWGGRTVFVDTKVFSSGAYYPPSLVDLNQVLEFEKHRDAGAVHAGYLVRLRKNETVVWIPSEELANKEIKTLKDSQQYLGETTTFDPRHIFLLNSHSSL